MFSLKTNPIISVSLAESLVHYAIDAIISVNSQGHVTLWNTVAENMFGYSESEALGQDITMLIISEPDRAAHYNGIRQMLSSEESLLMNRTVEIMAQKRDKSLFSVEMSLFREPVEPAQDHWYTAIIRDFRTHDIRGGTRTVAGGFASAANTSLYGSDY